MNLSTVNEADQRSLYIYWVIPSVTSFGKGTSHAKALSIFPCKCSDMLTRTPFYAFLSPLPEPPFPQRHRPSNAATASLLCAAPLCAISVCCIFCTLYLGSNNPIILNNLQAGSLGCAPTPSQYFALDVSNLISLNGFPSPKGAGLGTGS